MNKRIGAKSIAEIKKEFETADRTERKKLQMLYASDERSGVKNLIHRYLREEEKLLAEEERTEAMKCYERQYEHVGWICGIDEVGRGPLAGPVVAGAVILPKDCHILYINDSKKLSAGKREELYEIIMKEAVAVGIGMASPARIDEINILQATYEAMREAVSQLPVILCIFTVYSYSLYIS